MSMQACTSVHARWKAPFVCVLFLSKRAIGSSHIKQSIVVCREWFSVWAIALTNGFFITPIGGPAYKHDSVFGQFKVVCLIVSRWLFFSLALNSMLYDYLQCLNDSYINNKHWQKIINIQFMIVISCGGKMTLTSRAWLSFPMKAVQEFVESMYIRHV